MKWMRRIAVTAALLLSIPFGLWIGYTVRGLGAEMSDKTFVALVAAGTALIGGITAAFFTHILSLRAAKTNRQRDEEVRKERWYRKVTRDFWRPVRDILPPVTAVLALAVGYLIWGVYGLLGVGVALTLLIGCLVWRWRQE